MDKIITKIVETAVAPIIALLTDINNKLGLVTGVAVQAPAVTPVISRTDEPALTPSVPPTAVNVTPAVPASNITRESIGKALLEFSKRDDASLEKAMGLLKAFGATQLGDNGNGQPFVPVDKYPEFMQKLTLLASPAPKAAESLI